MPKVENFVQVEHGPRYAAEAMYGDVKIEVAAAYDIGQDDWRFHVYVQRPGDTQKTRISDLPTQWRATSMTQAFDQGIELAIQSLRPNSGFQQQVRPDLRS